MLHYERHIEEHVFELHEELQSGNWRHGNYEPFTICDPKQRLIHKATVGDRLVHQAIVSTIEPAFERQFIYDSYSCRKGKGTHAAVARLKSFLRVVSQNNTRTVYALKCDIKQFFATIDHTILRKLLAVHIQDKGVLALLDEVIDSLSTAPGKGIPLGNITSQLFANIYLHELDWFVKQKLGEKYYLRYCDDFILISHSRKHLESLIQSIIDFLERDLKLAMHPDKITIRMWTQGIDYLGYVLKPHCTVLRHKTKKRALNRVTAKNISSYSGLCQHVDAKELNNLLQVVAWSRD